MYVPKSVLSRLLGAAWTILLIAGILWIAVHLLVEVWIWLVVIVAVAACIRLGFWARRWRRDEW